jgi:hypothetical protein
VVSNPESASTWNLNVKIKTQILCDLFYLYERHANTPLPKTYIVQAFYLRRRGTFVTLHWTNEAKSCARQLDFAWWQSLSTTSTLSKPISLPKTSSIGSPITVARFGTAQDVYFSEITHLLPRVAFELSENFQRKQKTVCSHAHVLVHGVMKNIDIRIKWR